jgi:hypothetical protein
MGMKVLIRSKRCNGFYCHKYPYLHVSLRSPNKNVAAIVAPEQNKHNLRGRLRRVAVRSLTRSLYNFMAIKRST